MLMFYYYPINYLFVMLTFSGLVSVFNYRKQFLIMLLSLECVTLGLFLSVSLIFNSFMISISLSLFLLILGACEASLGLSLLIMMSRFKGNDMLSMINSFSC